MEELSNLPEAPQCRIQIQVNRSAHGLNFHVVPQSLLSWGLRGDADPGEGGLCLHSCRRPCSRSSPPLPSLSPLIFLHLPRHSVRRHSRPVVAIPAHDAARHCLWPAVLGTV